MMDCNKIDCPNKATHGVRLSLGVHPDHKPAISSYLFFVCEEHKNLQWDEVVDANGWQLIRQNFAQQGLAKPKREYSSLIVEKLPDIQ